MKSLTTNVRFDGTAYDGLGLDELPPRLLKRELNFFNVGGPVSVNNDVATFTSMENVDDDTSLKTEYHLSNDSRIELHSFGYGQRVRYFPPGESEYVATGLIDVDVSVTDDFDADLYTDLQDLTGELVAFSRQGIGEHHSSSFGDATPSTFTVARVTALARGKIILTSVPEGSGRHHVLPVIDNGTGWLPTHKFRSGLNDGMGLQQGDMYTVRSDGLYHHATRELVMDAETWNEQGCIDTSESFVPE